jgi:hypothetical protein
MKRTLVFEPDLTKTVARNPNYGENLPMEEDKLEGFVALREKDLQDSRARAAKIRAMATAYRRAARFPWLGSPSK